MEDHKALQKMVICTLSTCNASPMTARQIYTDIQLKEPHIERHYNFKSFCRLIPIIPNIIVVKKTDIQFYKLK